VRALWSLVDSQLTEKSPTKRRELDADLAGSRHWYIDFKSEVALSQQHHAVGQQQGLFHVVRHEQDGRAVSRTEVRYQLLHLETCQRVECGEGFIEQQQLRFAYQCARERDSLCLSPGERRGPHVRVRRQTNLFESANRRRAGGARTLEAQRDVLQTRLELTSRGSWKTTVRDRGTSSSPESGVSRPASKRSRVVLPLPLFPNKATNSPRRILKSRPLSAGCSPN